MNDNKKNTTKRITSAAIATAIIFLVTRFIQIPIPLGYFNIGNSVILLLCLLLFPMDGEIASGLGSALADLTSYPVYTLPTLVIKAAMAFVFYKIIKVNTAKVSIKIIAVAISTLIPLFGYTIVGMVLYGGFVAGIAQFPGLFLEYVANLIIFSILLKPVEKIRRIIVSE